MAKQNDYGSKSRGGNYSPEGAPVIKNGGNDAIHDHVETSGPKSSSFGQGKGNYRGDKKSA